jgi:hypothetical protein
MRKPSSLTEQTSSLRGTRPSHTMNRRTLTSSYHLPSHAVGSPRCSGFRFTRLSVWTVQTIFADRADIFAQRQTPFPSTSPPRAIKSPFPVPLICTVAQRHTPFPYREPETPSPLRMTCLHPHIIAITCLQCCLASSLRGTSPSHTIHFPNHEPT